VLFAAGVLQAAPRSGDILPKASVIDLKGANVTIPDAFKGKVAVVHFFATWCTYCPKEVTALGALYTKYRDKGLIACSVDVGESRNEVASFAQEQRVFYPLLLDPSSSAAKQYGVTGIPTTYILDRSGVIRFKILGEITLEGLDRIVRTLL
jgi:peroxiredoxin